MTHTTIEKELDKNGQCFIQTVGISMEPILHERFTTAVIEKVKCPLKRNDVVLFKRPLHYRKSGPEYEYVLHRIVKVREYDCLICGDNQIVKETVPKKMIIGVMKGYFDGDIYIDCTKNAKYLKYLKKLKIRYAMRWIKAVLARIVKKWKLK